MLPSGTCVLGQLHIPAWFLTLSFLIVPRKGKDISSLSDLILFIRVFRPFLWKSKHNSPGGFKKYFFSSAPLFSSYSYLATVPVCCSIYCLLRDSYLHSLIWKKKKKNHLELLLLSNTSLEGGALKICVISHKPLSYSLLLMNWNSYGNICIPRAVFLLVKPGEPTRNHKKHH